MHEQFGYCLKAYSDRLTLTIVSRPEEDHTEISDGETEIFYAASFCPEETAVRVECNVYGNLDMWLAMIREGKVKAMNAESDLTEIRRVFPVVQEIFNLEMFAHIYKTKGLQFRQLIPSGREKEYFTLQKDELPENITGDDAVIRTRIHKLPNEEMLLEIDVALYHGKRHARMLVSEDYVYSEEPLELSYLFYLESIVTGESIESDVAVFSERYPSFGLSEYWKNDGRNILLPLLSGNYHKGTELLSKSGCVGAAAYRNLRELYRNPVEYSDVKSFLGVPVSIARKVSLEELKTVRGLFAKLSEIWNYDRSFLDVPAFTCTMLCFIAENNIPHREQHREGWDLISDFSDDQVKGIIRYLASGRVEDYELFRDYLFICRRLHEFPGGLTPRNLTWAHDTAVEMDKEQANEKLAEQFRLRVSEPSYTELITEAEPDVKVFEKDLYMIIAPKEMGDLFRESAGMHNCVRIYAGQVAAGATKIYMMRRRRNLEASFVTIQVTGNRIVQVKAAYNKPADADAQNFILKWAAIKELRIDTSDIRRTA